MLYHIDDITEPNDTGLPMSLWYTKRKVDIIYHIGYINAVYYGRN